MSTFQYLRILSPIKFRNKCTFIREKKKLLVTFLKNRYHELIYVIYFTIDRLYLWSFG